MEINKSFIVKVISHCFGLRNQRFVCVFMCETYLEKSTNFRTPTPSPIMSSTNLTPLFTTVSSRSIAFKLKTPNKIYLTRCELEVDERVVVGNFFGVST